MSIWFWKLCWTHWREKNKKTRLEWEPAAYYIGFCHQLINSAPTQSSGSRRNTSFPNCKQWSISKIQWLTQCRSYVYHVKRCWETDSPRLFHCCFFFTWNSVIIYPASIATSRNQLLTFHPLHACQAGRRRKSAMTKWSVPAELKI